jgi:hypothetical protein
MAGAEHDAQTPHAKAAAIAMAGAPSIARDRKENSSLITGQPPFGARCGIMDERIPYEYRQTVDLRAHDR